MAPPHPRMPEPHGTPVRWRQGRQGAWRYGYVNGDAPERDGSVRVWDNYTGGARSLPAEMVQHQTRGPRGGRRWAWLTARPPETVTAVCPVHPSWAPPEGPAELFNQEPLFDLGEPGS